VETSRLMASVRRRDRDTCYDSASITWVLGRAMTTIEAGMRYHVEFTEQDFVILSEEPMP
jgi:hypothetical protein